MKREIRLEREGWRDRGEGDMKRWSEREKGNKWSCILRDIDRGI